MIQNVFVIDQGLSLYHFDFVKNSLIDEQLVSGFLSAIGSFAQNIFRKGLQVIQIQQGQKMSFYLEPKFNLLFCAISDEKDNLKLLGKLLARIAKTFVDKYTVILNGTLRTDIMQYKEFDIILKEILLDKERKRNYLTLIIGLFLRLVFGTLILTVFFEILFVLNLDQYTDFIAVIIFTGIGLFGVCFLAGFIAGNRSLGLINGLIIFIIVMGIAVGFSFSSILILTYFGILSPFCIVVCLSSGYVGGLVMEQMKLYPLSPELKLLSESSVENGITLDEHINKENNSDSE